MDQLFFITDSNLEQLELVFAPAIIGISYLVVIAAEMGDKSQLVCLVLAARYRAGPVVVGAIAAFVFLNSMAVVIGLTLTQLIELKYLSVVVAVMFLVFGIQTLRHINQSHDQTDTVDFSASRLVLTTFVLITVAEFGDKTQLAVVGLSTTQPPLSVWIGATLALISTTLLGVWLGRTLLQRISMTLLHKVSGSLFIILGLTAGYQAYQLFR